MPFFIGCDFDTFILVMHILVMIYPKKQVPVLIELVVNMVNAFLYDKLAP